MSRPTAPGRRRAQDVPSSESSAQRHGAAEAAVRGIPLGMRRISGFLLMGAVAASFASFVPVYSVQASSPKWAHQKAHNWEAKNTDDVDGVTAYETNVYAEMQEECTGDKGPGVKCESLTADPGAWSERIGADCSQVVVNVATVKTDGPIPLREAQRQWSTALSDLVKGCSAIRVARSARASSSAGADTPRSTTPLPQQSPT